MSMKLATFEVLKSGTFHCSQKTSHLRFLKSAFLSPRNILRIYFIVVISIVSELYHIIPVVDGQILRVIDYNPKGNPLHILSFPSSEMKLILPGKTRQQMLLKIGALGNKKIKIIIIISRYVSY